MRQHNGKKCPYCGYIMHTPSDFLYPTRDHVVPKSKGGSAILVVCYACNNAKGDMMPDEFLERLSGCRRTLARLAMIGALREALEDIETKQVAASYTVPSPFASTAIADAFARTGA